MRQFLLIFLGGGAGSVLRWLISAQPQKWLGNAAFPAGTLLVNIAGSFIIGLLTGVLGKNNPDLRFLLITGFCGGFTTFSTFSAENLNLLQSGEYHILALNITGNVLISLLAVYLGLRLGGQIA